jgi:hypothetical protein
MKPRMGDTPGRSSEDRLYIGPTQFSLAGLPIAQPILCLI